MLRWSAGMLSLRRALLPLWHEIVGHDLPEWTSLYGVGYRCRCEREVPPYHLGLAEVPLMMLATVIGLWLYHRRVDDSLFGLRYGDVLRAVFWDRPRHWLKWRVMRR